MKATVEIHNCPEDAYGYIVCRLSGGELWYWGCYETRREALKVADEFKNGLVVENGMPSDEYLRDLETSAHLDRIARKQEQEIMICPVCGRKIDKWIWRTTCCGAEIVLAENGKEIMMEDIKINMTNKEAIEALQEFALNYGLNGKMINAFGKAIRALEDQPEWISVSDRLPANANITEKEYLVQFANDGVTTLNYYDGWNCFVDSNGNYHNENEIENVLYWMELPKPKEVDEDDEN